MEAVFQEESMIAAAAGEAAPQKLEETANESICYQVIKSLNGLVISYVPQPYAGEMADLGVKFEKALSTLDKPLSFHKKSLTDWRRAEDGLVPYSTH